MVSRTRSAYKHAFVTAAAAAGMTSLSACGGGDSFTSPPPPPPPPVSTSYFSVKNCINLGSALEAPNEGDWGYTIRQRDINAISAAGFDTIRLPVRWDTHALTTAPYTIDTAWFARVDEVVNQATAANLGVIIDLHGYFPIAEDIAANREQFLAYWTQIAEHYRNAPANVYFEPFNEPENFDDMASVNSLYAELVPLIRQTNPTRAIILGGNEYSTIDTIGDVEWPDDDYLVATFHDYEPFDFTHQGASWVTFPPPLGTGWGSAEDQASMDFVYDTAATFKADNPDLMVFVGEYGVIDQAAAADRITWLRARRDRLNEEEISSCVWSFVGDLGLYNLDTESWIEGVLDAVIIR